MKRASSEVDALLKELAGHGPGDLNPRLEQLRELIAADRNGPLQLVNLLTYRETARYPAQHELAARNLTGAAAYGLYGAVALAHVTKRGGRLVAWNDLVQSLVGESDGWQQIAIMQYPNTQAFIDMLRDPDYQAALVHREAGLAKTAIWVTRPLLPTSAA